ncbi:MAG: FAD-binding oxidoreductase [Deltaproteobacteria bacterium]|nr:FAD-binding oxidoreductase [Deltaproteobacteria bacterium]
MTPKDSFTPQWFEGALPKRSYRSAFKWGAPDAFKHPNPRLYALMKEIFDLDDDYFKKPQKLGLEEVTAEASTSLTPEHAHFFRDLLGDDNVSDDVYSRLRVSYGKTMIDSLRLRDHEVENLPDLVLHPRDRDDVEKIVRYCHEQAIPLYTYGAGSGVTRGTECMKAGVSIHLGTHMTRVLSLNVVNQTVTVEPGILGPALEEALNQARERFGAPRAYTCGHFPQSFEFSSAGGWVVTRGAGQNSTYYGKVEDLVLSQEYITPVGTIKTVDIPAYATGPNIDQIMIGSEGAYGILVAVTLKIFRYQPENTRRFSFIFPDWSRATAAARDIMQSEFGFPSVFRLSDPEETDVAFKLYGVEGTPIDTLVSLRGFKKGERCLMLGTVDGDSAYTAMVKRRMRQVCSAHAKKWEHGRFTDPYMREDLQDYGIIIDTLECATSWDDLPKVHQEVRAYVKSRPQTVCMTHMSHCYPQGANLYFIFIAKMGHQEFLEFHRGLLDAIQASGAAMSHHHGIGKMTAPWLEGQIGSDELEVLRALKRHFDPKNVLNPGGTLALDLPDDERRLP